jgi:NADH-quinone oxidoreductase subunit F
VAVDVARTAVRLGAESVTVLYRRTRDQMPAYAEEVEEALKEGVKFEFLTAPSAILAGNGKLNGVRCARMVLGEFDRSGRRRPTEKAGDTVEFPADQVVAAIGQGSRPADFTGGPDMALGRGGWVEADPVTGRTSVEWIFAGGDAATGPSSVVEAIGAGERAAVGMDQFLTGANHAFWRDERVADTAFDPDADPVSYERAAAPELPARKRKGNFEEVEGTLTAAAAHREARRCLRCDYREGCE